MEVQIMEQHTLPEELKSRTLLFLQISVADIMFIGIYWVFMNLFADYVYEPLRIIYQIANVVIPIILSRPSMTNRDHMIVESLIFYIIRDKNTYHGVEVHYDEIEYKNE
jgi:hypothetical protein